MKKLCETEGHFYTYTLTGGKSKGCCYCGKRRMFWHVESVASLRAHAKLLVLARKTQDVSGVERLTVAWS